MDQVGLLAGDDRSRHPSPQAHWARRGAEWAVRLLISVIFFVAVGAKVAAPLVPTRAVEAAAIPVVSQYPMVTVAVVAGIELWLAGALLLSSSSRLVAVVGVALVGLFTAFLVMLHATEAPPACGCMGSFASGTDPEREYIAGLIRNAGMLCMLGWLAWRGSPAGMPMKSARAGVTRRATGVRPAFTIVELMVCISIIAILVAILLPALSRVRAQAHLTQALSGIRQVHASTSLYVADESDALPYIATPHRPWEPIVVRGVLIQGLPYFRQSNFVLSVVAPMYHDNPQSLRFTDAASDFPNGVISSRYLMTCTAFAAPAYWRGADPPDDLRLFVGSRSSDVAFPSSKGLWFDAEMSLLPALAIRSGMHGPWVVGRADGSAATDRYDPGYQQPFLRSYGAVPIPGMMTTVDGMSGRDF